MKKKNRTDFLIELLKDNDSGVSSQAMCELLKLDTEPDSGELSGILADLQETDEKSLRKKIHQMQAILKIRRRRASFIKRLNSPAPSMLQGLAELYAIWYDEIDTTEISKMWSTVVREAGKYRPVTPYRLASAMKSLGFGILNENIQDADLYCLGTVLEERTGAPVLLAAVALEIGRCFGLRGTIVRADGEFGIMYVTTLSSAGESTMNELRGVIVMPSRKWKVIPASDAMNTEIWSTGHVLRYAASMLFVNAVCSEGPRTIQVLASCLLGKRADSPLSEFLPYPFGKAVSEK